MSERELNQLLLTSVDTILETMFFTESLGPGECQESLEANLLAARISFQGSPSGTMAVCLPTDAARPLASGFLGEDEPAVSESQIGEVVCELANMVCGSVVSKLESRQSFDLSSPELVPPGAVLGEKTSAGPWARETVALETGTLTVTLELEGVA